MESITKRKSKGKGNASKSKRKRKPSQSEDESPAFLSSKYAEPPISKIYNTRILSNVPAELFRKDLISAMKLPDSEPLDNEDFILIEDAWRPEWERGVQVPVDPDSLPGPNVKVLRKRKKESIFKLPKKLVRTTQDAFFSPEMHAISFTSVHADQVCRYDMDDADLEFLHMVNEDREDHGLDPIDEDTTERIIDEIESVCFENFQDELRTENCASGDIDDDAICDVCRSPDSEEGNEIVFCDSCNMCVHQSCYGIVKIPVGSWICRTCALNVRPPCLFCPARGGAMKPTVDGEEWCHVSCAIWMPEVSFQHVEKMEPITKVHLVPASRWALDCSLCNERVGACIQCSFKHCKVAYHVTCAVKEGLKMRAIMRDDDDALKLKSFCQEHGNENAVASSESDAEEGNKNEMNFNDEVAHNIREEKIHEKEAHFFNYVTVDEIAEICQSDKDIVEPIFNYWKLKRRANSNHSLLPPKDLNRSKPAAKENHLFIAVRNLVRLRRDLERARNLCYMVNKREKIAKTWITAKKEIFMKQVELLQNDAIKLSKEEYKSVVRANQGDIIYDKIHSGPNGPAPNTLKVLNGLIGEESTKVQLNGILKMSKKRELKQSKTMPNPYKKHYLNGLLKRSQRYIATVDRNKHENMYQRRNRKRLSKSECESPAVAVMGEGKIEDISSYEIKEHSFSDADQPIVPIEELEETPCHDVVMSEHDAEDEYISFEKSEIPDRIKTESISPFSRKNSAVKNLVFNFNEIALEHNTSNNGNDSTIIKVEEISEDNFWPVDENGQLEETRDVSSFWEPIKSENTDEDNDFQAIKTEKSYEECRVTPCMAEEISKSNNFWPIKLESTDEDNVVQLINSEKGTEGSDFRSIASEKKNKCKSSRPIKSEKSDKGDVAFRPIKSEIPDESNNVPSRFEKTVGSISFKPIKSEKLDIHKVNNSLLTKRSSPNVTVKKETDNLSKKNSESHHKKILPKEENNCSPKTNDSYLITLEKKKHKLKKKKKNKQCPLSEVVDAVKLECIEKCESDEQNFVLSEETCSRDLQELVSSVMLVKTEKEDCDKLEIPKENVPLKNKINGGVHFKFAEAVLQPSETSDTDTNDSLLRRDIHLTRIKQSLLDDSNDTSSVKTIISTPEIQTCDSLNADALIKTEVSSPCRNETSTAPSSPSLKKFEYSPNSKRNRLVEHIMKESKERSNSNNSSFPNVSVPRKGSLTGYKIPKKVKPDLTQNSLEHKRGNSPLSPLTDRTPTSTTISSSYNNNNKSYKTWQKSTWKIMKSQKKVTSSSDAPIPSTEKPVWKVMKSEKIVSVDSPVLPVVDKPKPLVNGEVESRRVMNRNEPPIRPAWNAAPFNNPRRNATPPYWGPHDFPRVRYHNDNYLRRPPMRPWFPGRGPYHQSIPRQPFRSTPNT